MIYLDNSATSYPKPNGVYDAYKKAIKYYHSNPGRGGYPNSLQSAEMVYETREKAAAFFGEDKEENVVFTANCTQALNMVIKGLVKPGDHILISDMEHNAVVRVLEKLRRQSGIEYDTFCTDFYDDTKTLQSLKRLVKPETKLVVCTHASNVFGTCLPLQKIGKICREHTIFLCVDAAQSGGILPLNMKTMHIDFLCIAPHKGLYAPMGTGMLIGDGSKLDTILEGGTGSDSFNFIQPDFMPDKLESGTLNVCGIVALGAGIDFIRDYGRNNIYQKDASHIVTLFDALKDTEGLQMYVDYTRLKQFAPVFSFNIRHLPCEVVAQHLAQSGICVRAGLHCAPLAHKKIGTHQTGTIRISPSIFTTSKEINYTISTIKKLAENF